MGLEVLEEIQKQELDRYNIYGWKKMQVLGFCFGTDEWKTPILFIDIRFLLSISGIQKHHLRKTVREDIILVRLKYGDNNEDMMSNHRILGYPVGPICSLGIKTWRARKQSMYLDDFLIWVPISFGDFPAAQDDSKGKEL